MKLSKNAAFSEICPWCRNLYYFILSATTINIFSPLWNLGQLKEVIGNDCKTCTPEEKEVADHIKRFIQENYADVWPQIEKRYKL